MHYLLSFSLYFTLFSKGITAKPRDDVNDDEDNSVLSGQRAELQHVYFASRHSPASYQTSNSGDRFRVRSRSGNDLPQIN